MKKIIVLFTSFVLSPFVAFGASCDSTEIGFDKIGHMINWASCTLIAFVVPLLFSLATVGFLWGIIQYFLNPDNEEGRKKGKSYMVWGLLALFVMISMWGLVGVLTKTFGIQTLIPQLSQ